MRFGCTKSRLGSFFSYCNAGVRHGSGQRLQLVVAAGFWARTWGLLRYQGHMTGDGLWLIPCKAIHTIGMKRAIDIVFLDKQGREVKTVHALRPYRIAWCRRAYSAIELPAGYCRKNKHYSAALRRARYDIQGKINLFYGSPDEQSLCQRIR